MSLPTDDRQQSQLELEGLKRTLEWTEIQREQLLDRLDLLRLDNARLQDRVEELERQVEGLRQQQPMFSQDAENARQRRSHLESILNVAERLRLRCFHRLRPCWTDVLSILRESSCIRSHITSIGVPLS
jgi:uncharacterized protein YhaN